MGTKQIGGKCRAKNALLCVCVCACVRVCAVSGARVPSMKIANCLPSIGPHIVYCRPVSLSTPCRRFSNLPSRMFWVWLALVCAEKAIKIGSKPGHGPVPRYLESSFPSLLLTTTLFAVPVWPTMSVCILARSSRSKRRSARSASYSQPGSWSCRRSRTDR
jgi:hypothetical protein